MATKEPLDSASAETTVYYITNMIPTEEPIEVMLGADLLISEAAPWRRVKNKAKLGGQTEHLIDLGDGGLGIDRSGGGVGDIAFLLRSSYVFIKTRKTTLRMCLHAFIQRH